MMFALSGVFALRVTCIVDSEESRPRNARPGILYLYIFRILRAWKCSCESNTHEWSGGLGGSGRPWFRLLFSKVSQKAFLVAPGFIFGHFSVPLTSLFASISGVFVYSRICYPSHAKTTLLQFWRASLPYFSGFSSEPQFFRIFLSEFSVILVTFWGSLCSFCGLDFTVFFFMGHAGAPSEVCGAERC